MDDKGFIRRSNILLRELGHMLSGIAYGAPVYEMGVMINHLLPGAYTMVDTDVIKSRRKRVRILSAGVKSNMFLSGIFYYWLVPD